MSNRENWTYLPECNNSQMITTGQPEMEDLENWREKITIPDLTKYDWESIAAETTKNWDRENKVSLCMLLNGPSERLTSLMGFENCLYAFYDYPDEVHETFQGIGVGLILPLPNEVVECNSFTKAASRLNISQSTISKSIASLETMMGLILFVREKKSIRLTPAGKYIYENWKQLIQHIETNIQDAFQI